MWKFNCALAVEFGRTRFKRHMKRLAHADADRINRLVPHAEDLPVNLPATNFFPPAICTPQTDHQLLQSPIPSRRKIQVRRRRGTTPKKADWERITSQLKAFMSVWNPHNATAGIYTHHISHPMLSQWPGAWGVAFRPLSLLSSPQSQRFDSPHQSSSVH